MNEVLMKSLYASAKSEAEKASKIDYFRKKILAHLSKLEKEEETANKGIITQEKKLTKSGFPIGTIREWKGKKHIKVADGDWKPKYDGHTRGAKMAISAIKNKIAAAQDEREMMQIILKNRDRFTDKNGDPLPFVQELSRFVSEQQGAREKGGKTEAVTESPNKKENADEKPDSELGAIQKKYRAAKTVDGDDDELSVGKEVITGKWKLVEADTPTASHDEKNFRKTEGFPTNEDGSTINDRDYERDSAAQEAVVEIASDYDMQALSMDSPVIVTKDGIVISGNNRTMSSKIAARKGTDKKYIEGLKKKAKKFGFTAEQVGEFKNPRVVFEVDNNEGYSTRQFAKFNESGKKAMNPIESAVKVSKIMKSGTVENIAQKVGEFDTLGELYADKKTVNDIFNTLQKDGIIGQFDRPQYVTEEGITGAGKEFLETVLIGSVINEKNIRGLNREGCKSIRQKLVRAITPLIENKGMRGYSITDELNKAVNIAMQVATNKDKFNSVDEYSKQQNMFEEDDKVSIELAKRLEGTQKDFAEFMQTVNGGLKYAANGEADIFLGGVETKEDILSRFFELKKALIDYAINGALEFFNRVKQGKAKFEKRKVFLNKSGMEAYRWVGEEINTCMAKGGFIEGEHPREGDGRFSDKGGEENDKPMAETAAISSEELADFIEKSLENREGTNKRVKIGTVSEDAQKRIETKCGEKVNYINIDQSSIIHAVTQFHHNLEPEDILLAVDVINTTTDIELSDEKHQSNDVLVFQKDIGGDITFLTEVRAKNGYLLVFDAWRQKKARSRRRSNAAQRLPEAHAQNASPHNELPTILHKSDEESSEIFTNGEK